MDVCMCERKKVCIYVREKEEDREKREDNKRDCVFEKKEECVCERKTVCIYVCEREGW